MLILSRRAGESLKIGADITVTVLGVKGSQIRIGVNAPKHVPVHREELYERIQREQHQRESRVSPISDFERRYRVNRASAGAPLSTPRR